MSVFARGLTGNRTMTVWPDVWGLLDPRPPIEEIKRLAQTDASFGLAVRKLVNKEDRRTRFFG